MVIRKKGGMVAKIASVSLQDKRRRITIFEKHMMLFLRKTMIFPLTAAFADWRSFVILEMISPVRYF
jgi:hypothetical protein